MNMVASDYVAGDILMYREENSAYRVEVLEALGDAEYETYKLKVLEVENQHWLTAPVSPGKEFTCTKSRKYAGCLGSLVWELESVE